MNQIIVYGSEYGTTRKYAEKLAQLTGIEAVGYTMHQEEEKARGVPRRSKEL